MKRDSIVAICEIVSAIAVVISLIYLALQVRDQNIEARIASAHQVVEGYRTSISWLREPEMAAIFIDGIENYDGLDAKQRLQFDMYLTNAMRAFETGYLHWKADRLDAETWRAAMAPMQDVIATDTFKKFWARRKHHFREDWAAYIDQLQPGNGALWEE